MKKTKKRPKKMTLKRLLRRRLFSGLLVVVPLSLTVLILRFLYELTAGRLEPLTRSLFKTVPEYGIAFLSLTFLFVVTYGIGLVASVFVGRKVIEIFETILDQIPLVKTIYGASKQVVQSLSFQDGTESFQSVVLVDFPCEGMKAFAFVTSKVRLVDAHDGQEREHYRVFIPTTPNPTSGYLEFIPVDRTEDAGISVEDAVKTVMSAGLVMPATVGPASPALKQVESTGEQGAV